MACRTDKKIPPMVVNSLSKPWSWIMLTCWAIMILGLLPSWPLVTVVSGIIGIPLTVAALAAALKHNPDGIDMLVDSAITGFWIILWTVSAHNILEGL